MYTKCDTTNIPNTKEMKKECKRKRILRKRIKSACGIMGFLAFIFIFGSAGSLELNAITMGQFMARAIVSVGIIVLTVKIREEL